MGIENKTILLIITLILLGLSGIAQSDLPVNSPKPFNIHGTIGSGFTSWSGITERELPWSTIISGNAIAKYKGLEIPLSFAFTDRINDFAQPFNRFGMSPKYKWITLHLGYRNVTFSNFTLAGRSFLGAGIEMNRTIFRFGFVYGRFNEKTTFNPLFSNDSLPKYSRNGFAAKIGIGKERNFIDLIFLQMEDDSNSLTKPDSGSYRLPERNLVSGLNGKLSLFKRLSIEFEGAVSLYTLNTGALSLTDSTSDEILQEANKYIKINRSSEYYKALRAGVQYKAKKWSLKAQYRKIDPGYRSMGTYFISNDLENLTLSPSLRFFKSKLVITGSFGIQRNNTAGNKKYESTKTVGNANISFQPSARFGLQCTYSNYSIIQKAGRYQLKDSTKLYNVTQNFSIMPRYSIVRKNATHQFMLIANMSDLDDKNSFTAVYRQYSCYLAQFNYIFSLSKHKLSLSFGTTYSLIESAATDNTGIGGTLGITKSILKEKLSLNLSNSLIRSETGSDNSWVLNSYLSGLLRLGKHHLFRLSASVTGNYYDNESSAKSYTEIKREVGYAYSF